MEGELVFFELQWVDVRNAGSINTGSSTVVVSPDRIIIRKNSVLGRVNEVLKISVRATALLPPACCDVDRRCKNMLARDIRRKVVEVDRCARLIIFFL